MMKSIISITMLVIFSLTSTVTVSANQNFDPNYLTNLYRESSYHNDIHTLEELQYNKLLELQNITRLYNHYGVVPYNISNFPEYMPNIVFLVAPFDNIDGKFYIGLDMCIGDLTFEDRHGEEMLSILNKPIPSETIKFILDFAQISYEDTIISHSVYLDNPPIPPGEPLPDDRIDPWEYYDTNIDVQPYSNLNRIMRMGEEIYIDDIGYVTAGHPLNATGTSFFTAAHTTNAVNRDVFSVPAGLITE